MFQWTNLSNLPRIRVYGIKDADSPRLSQKGGVILFGVQGMMPGRVGRTLAERGGIGVRSGCHCAHMTVNRLLGGPRWAEQFQGVLLSLLPWVSLPGLVRVSFGIQNTDAEVDRLIEVLGPIAKKTRARRRGQRMGDFVVAAVQRVYAPLGRA